MRVKPGARIRHCSAQILFAAVVANEVFHEYGRELVITSGTDGKHSRTSLHYRGDAIDLRTREFDESVVQDVADTIAERLGPDFDVVVETTHIHLEYQPKGQ